LVVVAESVKTEGGQSITAVHGGGAQAMQTYGGIGHYIGAELAKRCGAETRVTVLGHVQRGGTPEPKDRILGSAFGVHAVDLIAAGKFDRMVAWNARQVIDVPILSAIQGAATVDPGGALVKTARGLGISFGD
jgi:6-phosphofructokinase